MTEKTCCEVNNNKNKRNFLFPLNKKRKLKYETFVKMERIN